MTVSPFRSLADVKAENALLWTRFATQFDALSNTSVLVDGNMEAVGTTAWSVGNNAVLSKETGAPYAGIRCLRVTKGIANSPYAYQNVCVTNASYRMRGVARSGGVIAPMIVNAGGVVLWSGTTSTSWQPFDVSFVANGATLGLRANTAGPDGYVEFDDVAVYPVLRVTENLGRYPGAPRLLTMGDGSTANTIPSQRVGAHGIVLGGTQYVDTGIVDVFERTDRFTLFVMESGVGAGCYLLSTEDQAQSNRGISITAGQAGRDFLLTSAWATNAILNRHLIEIGKVVVSHSFTYDGSSLASGLKAYANGSAVTYTSTTFNNLTATIKNGKPFLIGARHNGSAKSALTTGNIHNVYVFPWELSQQQIQHLHRQCMLDVNAA